MQQIGRRMTVTFVRGPRKAIASSESQLRFRFAGQRSWRINGFCSSFLPTNLLTVIVAAIAGFFFSQLMCRAPLAGPETLTVPENSSSTCTARNMPFLIAFAPHGRRPLLRRAPLFAKPDIDNRVPSLVPTAPFCPRGSSQIIFTQSHGRLGPRRSMCIRLPEGRRAAVRYLKMVIAKRNRSTPVRPRSRTRRLSREEINLRTRQRGQLARKTTAPRCAQERPQHLSIPPIPVANSVPGRNGRDPAFEYQASRFRQIIG